MWFLFIYVLIIIIMAVILKYNGLDKASLPLAIVWPTTLVIFAIMFLDESIDKLVYKIKGLRK